MPPELCYKLDNVSSCVVVPIRFVLDSAGYLGISSFKYKSIRSLIGSIRRLILS